MERVRGELGAGSGEEIGVGDLEGDPWAGDRVGDHDLFDLRDEFRFRAGDELVGRGVGDELGFEDGSAAEGSDESCFDRCVLALPSDV